MMMTKKVFLRTTLGDELNKTNFTFEKSRKIFRKTTFTKSFQTNALEFSALSLQLHVF